MLNNLAQKIDELPQELKVEVEDFVEFLRERRLKKMPGTPNFGWAGALKDLKKDYTSVELQHKISEWRIEKK